MTEINITPFTDVILVLLIIFMATTPLISQKHIEVKLPQSSSKETVEDTKQATITITSEGVVYLDSKIFTVGALKKEISGRVKKNPELQVILAADQGCRFRDVVKIIDILKELQVRSLNIATRSTEQGK